MVTAGETIIRVLADTFGAAFAFGNGRYTARTVHGTLAVRRIGPTAAAVEVWSAASRSAELDVLVRVTEALRAAGYEPIRDVFEVRVDWRECAIGERRAA